MSVIESYNFVARKKRFNPESRPFLREIIRELSENWESGGKVFLVEAPTGYGKTSISLSISHYTLNYGFKAIVAYPLRTLIEQQSLLFKELFGIDKVGTRYMHSIGSPYLVKPVTLTTIDTLAMNTLGLPPEDYNTVVRSYFSSPWGYDGHYLFARSLIDLSDSVLDEVHLVMDSTKSIGFLEAYLEHMLRLGRNTVLMSATLPTSLINELTNHLSKEKVKVVRFRQDESDPFVRDRLSKNIAFHPPCMDGPQCVTRILERTNRKRALIIFNTVREALRFYTAHKGMLEDKFCGKTLLLHSKYTAKDREEKTIQLENLAGEDCYAIVSTQVVEAGLDISSDILITELAPANSLIQRTGRLARWSEREGDLYIWYDRDSITSGKYSVYDGDLTRATLKYLRENGGRIMYNLPSDQGGRLGYRSLIEQVYDEPVISSDGYSDMARQLLITASASRTALDLLISYEGSFTRESALTGIVPVGECKEALHTDSTILLSRIIPISLDELVGIAHKGILCPSILRRKGLYNVEIDSTDKAKELIRNLSKMYRRGGLRNIVYRLTKMQVEAFITQSDYTSETGLILKW